MNGIILGAKKGLNPRKYWGFSINRIQFSPSQRYQAAELLDPETLCSKRCDIKIIQIEQGHHHAIS